ncbi:SusC/RagA family TonB-linked outer membrane protein [Botryobacter ruber]|uniref:SusC/RagA family TonB-linked outer membrane protein n=1 Tax=Botryobacter ruber TaxID=2171629 RepID=UPI000E0BD2BD|nr:SusC/RagA family TonB-linked outer membrane protein [Botryobacter ruber]
MNFYTHAISKLINSFPGKPLVVTKLTLILNIALLLQVSAASNAQRITLSERNSPLEQVLIKIKKQSGYNFLYNIQMLKDVKPVSLTLENATLPEALDKCFSGQPLTYVIENKTVIIRRMPVEPEAKTPVNVTGQVQDDKGEGLPGVSVRIKGTTTGTTTDLNGNYSLQVINESSILVFSFVGYTEQEVRVGSRARIDVKMHPVSQSLDAVVVVGYGTQKKSEVIGSVSQVGAREINDRTTPQLQQALTGQMPGVTVIQRSGLPGAPGGSIQIRGVGSFGAGAAPLILVDGIPVNSMNDIDPNDVENVSVLKDASSAAIYGSRAANGVILITTKTGKSEKLSITYNAYAGIQRPTNFPKFVNSWEYATLMNEATGGGAGGYLDEEIRKFKDGSDPDNYPNINYIDEIFNDNSLQTGHNFTVAKKNAGSEYLLSMGYMYQNGIIPENNFNRYNLRLNLTSELSSALKLTTRLSSIHVVDHQPNSPASVSAGEKGTLGIIGQAVRFPAIYPAKLSNGDYGLGAVGNGTPISLLESDGFYQNKTTDLNGNMRLDWEVVKGLKLSAIAGYTQMNGREDSFLATQRLNANVFLGPSTLHVENAHATYKTLQQLAEYTRDVGKHTVSLLAGHSYEAYFNENTSASRIDFPSNVITVLDAGAVDGLTNGGSAGESALDSYFGRVKYNYANKYLAEGTMRYDGSSRFPKHRKYAFFPSVAVGWRILEEKFLQNRLDFLNELKLKASYGVLGNQNIGNYPYQEVFSTN